MYARLHTIRLAIYRTEKWIHFIHTSPVQNPLLPKWKSSPCGKRDMINEEVALLEKLKLAEQEAEQESLNAHPTNI
jgi:hypothetical protein